MIDVFDKKKIKDFLKDPSCKKIIVPYKGERLNAACDWQKLHGSSAMLLRAFLNEILRKAPPCSLKNSLYRLMGVKIGKDVAIGPNVLLDPLFLELITIEDGVILGWGCRVITHEFLEGEIRIGRVHIGKGAVIGAWSTVRAGVTIGDGAMVSMNSFVNKDIKAGKAVGGVPAKAIKLKKHY